MKKESYETYLFRADKTVIYVRDKWALQLFQLPPNFKNPLPSNFRCMWYKEELKWKRKKKLQLMLFCCWPLVGYFGAIIFLSGNTNPSKIVTMTCSSFSSTDNDLRYTNSKPYLFWFTKNDYLEHIFINSWILKTNLGSSQYFFFIQIRMIRRKRSTFSFCPITMP